MILQTIVVGPLAVNCYVIADEHAREAIVIDPGGDVNKIRSVLKQHRLEVRAIVNTHAHFDHVGAIEDLRRETGAPFMMHEGDRKLLEHAPESGQRFGLPVAPVAAPDRWLVEGDELAAGKVIVRVIHTPGHSPGGICLHDAEDRLLFSGDTLFQHSIGRTDLPGASLEALLASIKGKLLTLPGDTIVYPGHGPSTTIIEEAQLNPFLKNYV